MNTDNTNIYIHTNKYIIIYFSIMQDNNLEFEFSIKWKLLPQHLVSQHMKVVLVNFNLNYKAMLGHYIMILEKDSRNMNISVQTGLITNYCIKNIKR